MWDKTFRKLIPELSVTNYNISIDFYVNIIGFEIDYKREENKFAMISINKAQIMISEINGNWDTGKLDYPYGRGINFQIEVENVDIIIKRLRENNIKIFREIMENWYEANGEEYGNKEFLVQDPDGYLLRFFEDIGIRNKKS
jgi:predicted enzyme related to lactoylglutathione lyase